MMNQRRDWDFIIFLSSTHWPVPAELIPFGWLSQARDLESMVAKYTLRQNHDGTPFVTDSGNIILDCHFGLIAEARQLIAALNSRAGIVEHDFFIGLATDLIVSGASGVQYRTRKA